MVSRAIAFPLAVILTWCFGFASAATFADQPGAEKPGKAAAEPAVSVVVVGQAEFFLTRALSAMAPQVTTRFVAPADLKADVKADLLVFVGVAPERAPEGVSALYVGVIPPGGGVKQAADADGKPAVVREVSAVIGGSDHPVMRGVKPHKCTFTNVRKLRAAQGWKTLLGTEDVPLMLISDGDAGKSRQMVLAFEPPNSDWPLKMSYPIFMTNAVLHLAGR